MRHHYESGLLIFGSVILSKPGLSKRLRVAGEMGNRGDFLIFVFLMLVKFREAHTFIRVDSEMCRSVAFLTNLPTMTQ